MTLTFNFKGVSVNLANFITAMGWITKIEGLRLEASDLLVIEIPSNSHADITKHITQAIDELDLPCHTIIKAEGLKITSQQSIPNEVMFGERKTGPNGT